MTKVVEFCRGWDFSKRRYQGTIITYGPDLLPSDDAVADKIKELYEELNTDPPENVKYYVNYYPMIGIMMVIGHMDPEICSESEDPDEDLKLEKIVKRDIEPVNDEKGE